MYTPGNNKLNYSRVPHAGEQMPSEGELIQSYPVLVRVGGRLMEAMAIPDINSDGHPYIRFEEMKNVADDPEGAQKDPDVMRVVDDFLGPESDTTEQQETAEALGALVVSSISGGEGIVDASGSRPKVVRIIEPEDTTIFPEISRLPDGKPVPVLRVAKLEDN